MSKLYLFREERPHQFLFALEDVEKVWKEHIEFGGVIMDSTGKIIVNTYTGEGVAEFSKETIKSAICKEGLQINSDALWDGDTYSFLLKVNGQHVLSSYHAYTLDDFQCAIQKYRNPYNEKNFEIEKVGVESDNCVVRSDSKKFGTNAIVFQGKYVECLDYIAKRENPDVSYYIIQDLPVFTGMVRYEGSAPQEIERFKTIEEAIVRFNEYKSMEYLSETYVNLCDGNTGNNHVLVLGVSIDNCYEADLIHATVTETKLLSDSVGLRDNKYPIYLTNKQFVEDLNKILSLIDVDVYSYYREMTINEFAENLMKDCRGINTKEEAMDEAQYQLSKHPYYLKNNKINEKIPIDEFDAPFITNAIVGVTKTK